MSDEKDKVTITDILSMPEEDLYSTLEMVGPRSHRYNQAHINLRTEHLTYPRQFYYVDLFVLIFVVRGAIFFLNSGDHQDMYSYKLK